MAINKPSPYVPSFLRAALSGSRPLALTWSDVADTNIASTSSFQYEPQGSALKSTQQLNVDWSQFQNHTFFMSAEAKVNLAFESIINGFPFDGTRQEIEVFFEKLTGFERWVFDQFPRFRGQLFFSGCYLGGRNAFETFIPEQGTFIEVKNQTGALFPEISRDSAARQVLNPTGGKSLTIETMIYLPTEPNYDSTICQMLSGSTQGFSLGLLQTNSTASCPAQFIVVSGSSAMTVKCNLKKGEFNHLAVVLNRDEGMPYLEAFLDAQPVAESATQVEMGDFDIDGKSFLIGSGTRVDYGSLPFIPTSSLSAIMDEFRVFHSARTPRQQATYESKSLFATDDLVLYYKFNEPPPPIAGSVDDPINAIVLDSSGNSLHALIQNFSSDLRLDASTDANSRMRYEHPELTAVLFPAHPGVIDLNRNLLLSASEYDQANPNLITRLIPQHYLLDGAAQEGFIEPEGDGGKPYGGTGIPGQGKMGNVQIMLSLLYIWAKFFDELKLYVDSFSTVRTVDYHTDETIPDNLLLDMVKNLGFHLPPLFNDSTVDQYIRGENVDLYDITSNVNTLRAVQNTLLRRVLVNLPDVLKSKGTQHSIKSFLRAVGIDPGNNVRIREYGGPTAQHLSYARESKIEPGTMVQFSPTSMAMTPWLTASHVEPGFPTPTTLTAATGNPNAMLTSGSWTWESIVKYTPVSIGMMQSSTQSLAQLWVATATDDPLNPNPGAVALVANLLAMSSSVDPKIVLYARPGALNDFSLPPSPLLTLTLPMPTDGGIFNFDKWNVSFGRRRGDDGLNSPMSSSWFLRLAYQNAGKIEYYESTSSFFQEETSGDDTQNLLQYPTYGSGGPVFVVGSAAVNLYPISLPIGLIDNGLGDGNQTVPPEAQNYDFSGLQSNMRFWTRALTESEWQEHVRNYNSTGVEDPLTHWNYVNNKTGSYGRLRMNTFVRQDERRADATSSVGSITFLDMSENLFHVQGTGFPIEQDIVVGDIFELSYLSPYFDEATTEEKIRVRSYQNQDLIDATPWASTAPVYEIVASERPTDDVRFTIEFSLIDALNRDIITMFATLDAMDNALGAPELVFSPDYPDLERMRNVYFNRIKEKLNFQAFFEFFRWFDTSIGTFIQQLIPKKTRFKGTNFTVESHVLERAKQEYYSSEIYLGDSIRQNLNTVILLQQIAGQLRKY